MKRKFLVGLLGALAFTLASCGNNEVPSKDITEVSSVPGTLESSTNLDDDVKLDLSIVAPAGAPSICLAGLINQYSELDSSLGFDATTLPSQFAKGEKDAIIAPINMGATQYKKNGNYKLAAVVTWGNLYFASYIKDFKLSDLNGKTIKAFGENTINDEIIKKVLNDNGISCTIEYLNNTNLTKEYLAANEDAICVVAEPAISGLRKSKPEINIVSLQTEYAKLTGTNSYPQAGLFINTKSDSKKVTKLLTEVEKSSALCNSDVSRVADLCVTLNLGAKPVLLTAIPNSNIKYVKASLCKNDIQAMYNLKPALFGGELMADSFYYE